LAFHSGCEADHSPLSRVGGQNGWNCTSTPPCTFMAWCSVRGRTTLPLPFHIYQYVLSYWFGQLAVYWIDISIM